MMKMIRVLVVSMLCAGMLGACASGSMALPAQSIDQAKKTVLVVSLSYNVALAVAVAYNKLPRCEQLGAPLLCSKTAVVVQLRKANEAASASLDAAESAVQRIGESPTVVNAAVVSAQSALDAFKKVLVVYNVGGG